MALPTNAPMKRAVGADKQQRIIKPTHGFPGLDTSKPEGTTVTSATVRVRDLMCEDDPLDVSCHIFTGSEWDEDSATWANAIAWAFTDFIWEMIEDE